VLCFRKMVLPNNERLLADKSVLNILFTRWSEFRVQLSHDRVSGSPRLQLSTVRYRTVGMFGDSLSSMLYLD
jgi:hypothetical protein